MSAALPFFIRVMRKAIYIILIVSILVGVIFLQHKRIETLRNQPMVTDTVTLIETDTITLVKPTIKIKEVVRYDTLVLYTTDTLIDTFQVMVPISSYTLDTTLPDSTHLFAVLRGFNTEVDSISIEYPKVHQTVCLPPKKWSFSYGFVLGIGFSKQF